MPAAAGAADGAWGAVSATLLAGPADGAAAAAWAPLLAALGAAAITAWAITALWLRHARQRQLLDVPNHRSSHAVPTLRGGGVGFVVAYLAWLGVLGATGAWPWAWVLALGGAGVAVAAVGLIDDAWGLKARWRFVAHGLAAAWVLAWVGLPPLVVAGMPLAPAWLLAPLWLLALVWGINLYNFMDGIDGIAAAQAITVGLGGAAVMALAGQPGTAVAALGLTAAVAGFAGWNWAPARIFMGDVGSGFLGATLGGLVVVSAVVAPATVWAWLILLAVFVTDATVTLLRRLVRGVPVHQAHREHAYQHLAQRWGPDRTGAHRRVGLCVVGVNMLWLAPLALASAHWPEWAWLPVLLAYVPLTVVVFWFKGGQSRDA